MPKNDLSVEQQYKKYFHNEDRGGSTKASSVYVLKKIK